MPAIHDEAAFTEAVGEHRFHLLRPCIGHRVEVRVQPRDEALAETPDDTGSPDALLVVLETLLRREAGHADVVGGLAVAARVAEIDDVDGMG
jgi:hypothetical protein